LTDDNRTVEAPLPELDERSVARKYGLRELIYPDSEQIKSLTRFLDTSLETGKCGATPKLAVVVTLEFLQGTINRQHITKGPRMSQEEFDVLQTPYYLAARIVQKLSRERQENIRGKIYQTTYVSMNHFIELLRNLVDPGCYWLRLGKIPDGVREAMEALREFLTAFPEQRKKGRAT
jgi:hypothetical protein